MSFKKHIQFVAAIALQLFIIASMIVFKGSIILHGDGIMLHIQPVDPRDLLRGDYMTFSFDISTVKNNSGILFQNNETIYVPLSQQGEYWQVKGNPVRRLPTTSNSNLLYLKGYIADGGNTYNDSNYSSTQTLRIRYGIEEYFIPEGTGQNINFNNYEAAAQVSVDKKGNAVLREVYLNGQPWSSNTNNNPSRNLSSHQRSMAARVQAALTSVRPQAEIYYGNNPRHNYGKPTQAGNNADNMCVDPQIMAVISSVESAPFEPTCTVGLEGMSYTFTGRLPDRTIFCVDSTGLALNIGVNLPPSHEPGVHCQ